MRNKILILSVLLIGASILLNPDSNQPAPLEQVVVNAESQGQDAAYTISNPAATYCQEMGLEYKTVKSKTGDKGVCVMPDKQACDQWDFWAGKCGAQYSYCAQHNYAIRTVTDGKNGFSREYALCIDKTTEKPVGSVSDLAKIQEKSVGCGLGVQSPIPERPSQPDPAIKALGVGTPPSSFDWRSYNGGDWLTPIRNQGGCGSCWAFSAVGVAEAVLNIAQNNPAYDKDLAEQYLVSDCSDAGTCCGGWHSSALDYMVSSGIPDEGCMSYVDGSGCSCSGGTCGSNCAYNNSSQCSDRACGNRCGDWSSRIVKLSQTGYVGSNRATIQQALVNYGPLSVAMRIGSNGYWDGDIFRCSVDSGVDHAVVVVGYNDSGSYWIVRNSWGSSWNGNGYLKVGYGECSIEQYVYYATAAQNTNPPGAFNKSAPGNGQANQPTSLALSWGGSSNATRYDYCYDTTNDNACSNWTNNGTSTSASLSNLTQGATYYWQARAVNSNGTTYANGSAASFWSFTVTPPNGDTYEPDNSSGQAKSISSGSAQTHSIVPANDADWVKFQLGGSSAITLATSGSSGADTRMWLYDSNLNQVEANDDNGSNLYSFIDRTCETDPLSAGTYYVKVDEYGNDNEISSYNIAFNVTTTCGTPPAPPSNLTVSGATPNSVTIAWQDNSNNETGFNIYRWAYDDSISDWAFMYLDSVAANVAAYTQTGLDCGNDFNYYEVSAYNGNGESGHTSWVQGTTAACPLAELTIVGLTFHPTEPFTNDNVYVFVEVQNNSSVDAPPFWIDVYADDTPTGCSDWGSYYILTNGLAANTSDTFSVKIPSGSLAASAHEVRVFVDSGCEVSEGNENNNIGGPLSFTAYEPPPAPDHDDISSARLISPLPFSDAADVSGATIASDDPAIPASSCNLAPGLASVWYQYTPPANTALILDTYGSAYDTYLAVWSGSPGSLSLVGCNDDYGGGLQSSLQVSLNAGTTYYVEAAQYNGPSGLTSAPTIEFPPGAPAASRAPARVAASHLSGPPQKPLTAAGVQAGGSLYLHVSSAYSTFTAKSTGSSDGWIMESTEASNLGGLLNAAATTFNLGDYSADRQYRSILSFNTAGLPDNAVITKVTLKIKAYGALVGDNNPFSWGSGLKVDVCKNMFGATSALHLADFNYNNTTNCKLLAGTFGSTPTSGWYSVNLLNTAWSKINLAGLTQFRLRFAKDDNDDRAADYWRFYSGNAGAATQPQLIIEYTVP